MKTKTLSLFAAPLAIVAAMGCQSALAADGVLTVTGQVTASPCYIDNISGPSASQVTMTQQGSLSQEALATVQVPSVQDTIAPGVTGAGTGVDLHFSGGTSCANATYKVKLTPATYFSADPTIAMSDLKTSPSSFAAVGVGIQALIGDNGAGGTIDFSNNAGQTLGTAASAATSSSLGYEFRLARPQVTATNVNAGTVQTAFVVTIQ